MQLHWQYFCNKCGTTRDGLLDHEHGIGGYSWTCPKCGGADISSRRAEEIRNEDAQNGHAEVKE